MKSPKKSSPKKSPLKGGRRTFWEKLFQSKCSNELNFEDQEPIDPQYALRIIENNHTYCFDARSLYRWLITFKHKTNPFTNEIFSQQNVLKIYKKFMKLKLIEEMRESDFLKIRNIFGFYDSDKICILQLTKTISKIFTEIKKIKDVYIANQNFLLEGDFNLLSRYKKHDRGIGYEPNILIKPTIPRINPASKEIKLNESFEYNLYIAVPESYYKEFTNLMALNFESYESLIILPKINDFYNKTDTQFVNANFTKIKLYNI